MTSLSIVSRFCAVSRRAATQASRREFSALIAVDDLVQDLPTLSPTHAKAPSGSVTTLSNGLTIVSEDSCTLSTVTLTFPKAGSSNESIDELGAAFLNKHFNFKSASGLSTVRINRTIEDHGGTPFTTVDRKSATLGYTVVPECALGLVPLLASKCSFEKWDLRDAVQIAEYETSVANSSAQVVLTENLFAAAYGPQSPAGRPLFYSYPSRGAIMSFREKAYGLNGAVLAMTGVKNHAQIVAEVESLLADSPQGDSSAPAPMVYVGGESRIAAPTSAFAHVALAFPAPSSSVMSSVVKHFFNLAGLESGVTAFTSSGLIGVYTCSDMPASTLESLAKAVKEPITSELVSRAKKLAKSEALLSLDGGSASLASFMTASVLESGKFAPEEISKSYDLVSESQVKSTISQILKSNPSVASIGNISLVPYHATAAALLS